MLTSQNGILNRATEAKEKNEQASIEEIVSSDSMVEGGIKAVWNFTPFRIRVPENIVVQNTSLYAHLAVMFNRLNFNEIK